MKLTAVVALGLAMLLAVFAWPAPRGLRPPALALVGAEPAGVFDEQGTELVLVTLRISNNNPEDRPDRHDHTLYIADSARAVEVSASKSWKKIEWATNLWGMPFQLRPGQRNERGLVLLPAGKDRYRVWFKYAVPAFSGKGVLEWIASRLPLSVRSRFSYKFWRWVGFPSIYREGPWRESCVELTIPGDPSP
jgi:hypothetical protein